MTAGCIPSQGARGWRTTVIRGKTEPTNHQGGVQKYLSGHALCVQDLNSGRWFPRHFPVYTPNSRTEVIPSRLDSLQPKNTIKHFNSRREKRKRKTSVLRTNRGGLDLKTGLPLGLEIFQTERLPRKHC